jgi:hypothetical protein
VKGFFDQKLQFTYVQATEEAFGPKKTSSTSKNEIYEPYPIFVVILALLDPSVSGYGYGSGSTALLQNDREY